MISIAQNTKIKPVAKFDRKITAQKLSVTQDDAGGAIETWADIYQTWASVQGLRSSRILQDNQTELNNAYEIQMRYAQGREVNKSIRFLYDNKILTINQARLIEEGNKRFWVVIGIVNE